jgi:RNA polymerase sigma-70 factor (ECF subfamily)
MSEPGGHDGDGDLLARAADGDGDAFRSLLDRHAGRVFATAYRVLGDRAEAEDTTQESFARLWRVLGGVSTAQAPDRDAAGWLIRAARNLSIDRLRRRKRWADDETAVDREADGAPNAEATRQSADVARRVRAELDALPDRQRAALALVHFEGMRQAEAAESLGVSVEALESLLARGRRALKARLAGDREDLI